MKNLFSFDFSLVSKYRIIYTEKYHRLYLVNVFSFHLNILKMHLFVFIGYSDVTKVNFWKKKWKENTTVVAFWSDVSQFYSCNYSENSYTQIDINLP